MNPHKKFILEPVSNILKEAVQAINPIGSGIETYPLLDYVMQSVFIKMTGAQEQKLKCIAWELATNDYDFRREFLDKFNVEFSHYDDKNKLYKKLIEQIKLVKTDFQINSLIDKNKMLDDSSLGVFLDNSNIIHWSKNNYNEYMTIFSTISCDDFFIEEYRNRGNSPVSYSLFKGESILHNVYANHLYKNRNHIAHNTKSSQQNLPTLERLKSDDYQYENYFLWFSILILIDEVFMELYKVYLETLEQKTFI